VGGSLAALGFYALEPLNFSIPFLRIIDDFMLGVSNTAHAGIRRNAIAETSTVAPIRNDLVSSLPQPHEKQNGHRLARTRG
jgi:hypothetical protein